jgi:molybdopterin/thiamine biosynthesis adenylyltransferase/rhodanese-related sulfurtransferase
VRDVVPTGLKSKIACEVDAQIHVRRSKNLPHGVYMTDQEKIRYQRHAMLPEIGIDGQEKLSQARVAIVGMGGLGCPAAIYLASAGVGTLGIIDHDCVDLGNLHRQILYQTDDVGKKKVDVAGSVLEKHNPNISIVRFNQELTTANAKEVLAEFDYVIDGSDNFPTRYLVNDACVLLGKINIFGCIYRWEGQLTVFDASRGPCYRCLFPNPPSESLIPNCAQAGVVGVLPGIIGSMQALETIKLILGMDCRLLSRLMTFDASTNEWNSFAITKEEGCDLCGRNPTISKLTDYENLCQSTVRDDNAAPPAYDSEVTVDIEAIKLNQMIKNNTFDGLLLDVREPFEYDIARIEGARLIPLGELENRIGELSAYRNKQVIIYCHHGPRALRAIDHLRSQGFEQLQNLAGGIDNWSSQIDQSVTRY